LKKKVIRRYRITAKKGITGRIYKKETHHKKLPPVGKVYTKEEIKALEKTMDLRITKKPSYNP
jgi:hypothetical protein